MRDRLSILEAAKDSSSIEKEVDLMIRSLWTQSDNSITPEDVIRLAANLSEQKLLPACAELLKAAREKHPSHVALGVRLLTCLAAQKLSESYLTLATDLAHGCLGSDSECCIISQALMESGANETATTFLERAVKAHGGSVFLWHNLAVCLFKLKRLEESLVAFRRAIELRPYSDLSMTMAGSVLRELGRLEESIEFHGSAIRINPKSALALYNLGNALQERGELEASVQAYQQALVEQPEWPELLNNLSTALGRLGRPDEMLKYLLRFAKLRGNPPEDLLRIAVALKEANKPAEALEIAELLIQQFPDCAAYRLMKAGCLTPMGRSREASEEYERIIQRHPDNLQAYSSLIYVANYHPYENPADLFEFYKKFGLLLENASREICYTSHPRGSFPRKLRVGYVSGDFCNHPVGTFMEPLLTHQNTSAFETFCYYNHWRKDRVTKKLRELSTHWRDIFDLPDTAFCELVQKDQIDILVDLSGHSARNRLAAFALKPAPIQVTMIGCMQTTGLRAIDYRITDAILDPTGKSEHLHTEKLVRMKTGPLCFMPHPLAPEISGLPCLKNGTFTFGSFNNLAKATPQVLDLWSKVLLASPKAMMQVSSDSPETFLHDMELRGVSRGRIRILPRLREREYLEAHADVDLILDTFPYCGLTVSLIALWMGVPMVNLVGNTSASRAGASLLTRLDLTQFITASPEEYLRTAIHFTNNPSELEPIRQNLRTRMRSTWADTAAHTKEIEEQFIKMWETYAGEPPFFPTPTSPNLPQKKPQLPQTAAPSILSPQQNSSEKSEPNATRTGGAHLTYRDLLLSEIDSISGALDPGPLFSETAQRLRSQPDPKQAISTVLNELVSRDASWKKISTCAELYAAIGESAAAEKSFDQSFGRQTTSAEWAWLARSLLRAEFSERAEAAFREACAFADVTADATLGLACILSRRGEIAEAEKLSRRTIAKSPSVWEAYFNLANLLYQKGEFEEALKVSEPAARISEDPKILLNLAAYQQKCGDFLGALKSLEKIIEKDPKSSAGYLNLGNSFLGLGMPSEALAAYKKSKLLNPAENNFFSNYLHCLNYVPGTDPREVFESHCEFSEKFEAPFLPHKAHANLRNPRKRLRIAYVSPDLREHSVAYFIEPLLRNHDRTHFEVVGVLTHTWKDKKTDHFRSLCDQWIDAGAMSDHALAERLRNEEIDIAVDLICHSQGSRAIAFAQKPAPIQITMIGMQQTTGLKSMDFRVSDAVMDPPGMSEQFHSEKLLRLPTAFCLQPPSPSPAVAPLPALQSGVITFGSFNNFAKAHSGVLNAWAEVLRRIPNSRLVVVAPKGTALEPTMEAAGVALERIIIAPRRSDDAYLHMHDEIDIMLDCFPFAGLTVSVIAAWMGVPTLTTAGNTPSSRAGASLMHSMGLENFVAADTADFIQKAESLSSDLQTLSSIRSSLRDRMAVHLTNGPEYTRAFEGELRKAWENYCASEI